VLGHSYESTNNTTGPDAKYRTGGAAKRTNGSANPLTGGSAYRATGICANDATDNRSRSTGSFTTNFATEPAANFRYGNLIGFHHDGLHAED
jgi:hypothetical protein